MIMQLLSVSFFSVGILSALEMTKLTIINDRLYDEVLIMERDLAKIFLFISIVLSLASYGT